MAQFKKHLFGSAYFGYTNTFEGVYTTEVIDADEPFTGTVDYKVKIALPECIYYGKDEEWAKLPTSSSWSVSGNYLTTAEMNAVASYYLSTDKITLIFDSKTGYSTASIRVSRARDKSVVYEGTIDTSTTAQFVQQFNYDLYYIEVKNTDGKRLRLESLKGRVTSFKLAARTSKDNKVWNEYEDIHMTQIGSSNEWTGSSTSVSEQRFVQTKVALATSDIAVTPEVDVITVSSGDTSTYANDGWWYCAVDLASAARNAGTTFKKAKRVEWKEATHPQCKTVIRSTSTKNTFPTKDQVSQATYWKEESAPYVVNRTSLENSYGTPWSRIALKKGIQQSSLMSWEMSPAQYGLANTKNTHWNSWNDQSFYPLQAAGTKITYEFYINKNDLEKGIPPVLTITDVPNNKNRTFSLPANFKNQYFYVRIQMERVANAQTPVVDFLDMYGTLKYSNYSTSKENNAEVSAIMDNQESITHATVNPSDFNWPSNAQILPENRILISSSERKISIEYKSKYPGQLELYFQSKTTEANNRNVVVKSATDNTFIEKVKALTIADTPVASTQQVDPNRLVFHYAYDGGIVQFPNATSIELPTNYTPDLIDGKKYRFKFISGWPDEYQLVPFSMTWKDFAEMYGQNETTLVQSNPNIRLYNGKLPQGLEVKFPNTSLNLKVNLRFKLSSNYYSDSSIWNSLSNDNIIAEIPSDDDFSYTDWTSEEKIYTGFINANDKKHPYIRTQKVKYTSGVESTYVVKNSDTYDSIAKKYGIDSYDLQKSNNNEVLVVGSSITIPANFSLPAINPEAIFDNTNPYIVELIPYSVKRKDQQLLKDDIITLGSDDEKPLSYTYTNSEPITISLVRGSEKNGQDPLPYAGVNKILSIIDANGINYIPHSIAASGTETGDYKLTNNYVDWSTHHNLSKEPAMGTKYTVVLQYSTIDSIRVVMTSDYKESIGYDKLWRSEDVKTIEGIVTPSQDYILELPNKTSYSGFNSSLTDVEYVVEDDDLWVKTYIETNGNKSFLHATMNNENPKRNWYPEINTGFYYLQDQEYYLFSEQVSKTYQDKEIPIINNVLYSDTGLYLQEEVTNLLQNSTLELVEPSYEIVC
ncbi:LysM peptidoglycan-binding domain-containing protein [Enterococcus sp. DIV1059_2]|uniref:LysM peptidoglycan-binding domain-containing protein n=1 Tax=Enterococcus sp. DIV1059_2 TaxID=2774664 RepID=UPI003F29A7E7